MAIKTLSILGVTGTIGQNCLKVLRANPGAFQIAALTAQENVAALAEAAIETRASFVAIGNEQKYQELKEALSAYKVEIASGREGILEAASRASDVLLAAIVGAAGLEPTMKAVERGARIALANKECLVSAGAIFMQAAAKHGAEIIPVDSEHNAIFQLMHMQNRQDIRKITLTASGGPFRNLSLEQMRHVTPAEAVKHPNWNMGAKISVDSASMANKGLELIEAKYLFAVQPDVLDVLVHPESIVHGLVEMKDGSVLAQMSVPDMCIPIAYALGFPKRLESTASLLDLAKHGMLSFEAPDMSRFPALKLAMEAMKLGSAAECAFNAANEVAVAAFLEGKIEFMDIARHIEEVLTNINHYPINCLEDVLLFDQITRAKKILEFTDAK